MRSLTGYARRAQISPGRCANCWCTSAALTVGTLATGCVQAGTATGDFHPMSSRPCGAYTLRSRGLAPAGRLWPPFHSGPHAPCRREPLMSNVRRHKCSEPFLPRFQLNKDFPPRQALNAFVFPLMAGFGIESVTERAMPKLRWRQRTDCTSKSSHQRKHKCIERLTCREVLVGGLGRMALTLAFPPSWTHVSP